ncbi:MAG: metalloregulator ArsR/SmtB family transcription factor [Deltaproteobacteria bacterium]|nr:metalloregulator ArsR/SmtB family transcription factor [Deltaproteobacteria bacterium]
MKLPILDSEECCSPRRRLKAKDVVGFTALLRALSDETRLQIVAHLGATGGAVCVCDIEARFDLKQPTISHHLRVLRDAGLVSAEKRGTWVYYRVDVDRIDALLQLHQLLSA